MQFDGTGPFRFQEQAPGDHLTVRSNAPALDCQVGNAYLDQAEPCVFTDSQAALVRLEAVGLD